MCFSFARQSERISAPHRLIGRGASCGLRGGVAGRSPAVKQVEAPRLRRGTTSHTTTCLTAPPRPATASNQLGRRPTALIPSEKHSDHDDTRSPDQPACSEVPVLGLQAENPCRISEPKRQSDPPPAAHRATNAPFGAHGHETRPRRHRADRTAGGRPDRSDAGSAFGAVRRCLRARAAARGRARLGLLARQRTRRHPTRRPTRPLAVRSSARAGHLACSNDEGSP